MRRDFLLVALPQVFVLLLLQESPQTKVATSLVFRDEMCTSMSRGQMHTLFPGGHALFLPSVARQGVKASDGRLPREHLCAAGGHRSQSKSTNAPGSDRARRVPGAGLAAGLAPA